MPRELEKNAVVMGDATLESRGQRITFPVQFADWKKTCRGLSGSAIGVKIGSLLSAVQKHAIPVRPASDNDGNTGSFTKLKGIDSIIRQRKNGIYFEDDADKFEIIARDIADLLDHDTLNPQNIMFSVPEKYDRKGNYAKGVEMVPVYGHYLDKYFKLKHNRKDGDPSWVNASKNVATPPIYQALAGGSLVTVGLLEIMENAVKELDEMEYHLIINTSKPARYLTEIPSFRSALAKAIGSSKNESGEVSVSKVTSKLKGREYDAPTDGKTHKLLSRYANLKSNGGVAGDFSSFELVLTDAKTKALIKYYMQSNMQVKTRTLIKSWTEILVV